MGDSDVLEPVSDSEPGAMARFLEIETRKRDRTLSKDARQAARSLAEIILNRWVPHSISAQAPFNSLLCSQVV